MEIKTASSRMQSLVALNDIHSDYFIRALYGISDDDAHRRLETSANHIAWIAGSTIYERFETSALYGSELKFSADELFKDYKGIQDGIKYPSLEEYRNEWKRISPVHRELLVNLSDEKLDSIFEIPEMKMPYYDLMNFMTYREANMIGQIALWRRLLGYEGMKYQ